MKHYTLYFEFYGRRMKTTVMANSLKEAREMVRQRIKFEEPQKEKDSTVEFLKGMFGIT